MPDGQVWTIPKANLAAAQARGAKPFQTQAAQTKQPSTYERLTSPIDPGLEKFSQEHPIASIPLRALSSAGAAVFSTPESVYQMARHPIESAKSLGRDVAAWGKPETWKGAASVLPEAIGTGIGSVAAGEAVGKVTPKIGEVAGKASKGAARELVGVGKGDIAKAIEDSHTKVTEAHENFQKQLAEHSEKVDKATAKVADKIADVQKKRVEASAKQTAAETRQAAISTKRGPVYQRLTGMADEASENVQLVDKKVRALESAKWNEFKKGLGGAEVEWTPWQKAVQEAQQNILGGVPENIAVFKQILKETGDDVLSDASVFKGENRPGAIDIKEFTRTLDPRAQEQLMRELKGGTVPSLESGAPTEGLKIPFDNARAWYTKLGQKIASVDMPNQVSRALRYVQDAGDAEITRSVAKSGGRAAVETYRKLKSDWRDYMQTFYDKDSPIRKLKEGKDPNDKLNPVVGDEGERAIQLFGKYRSLGADVQSLGKMRALFKSIKELPSSGAKMPGAKIEGPKIPKAPEAPTEQPLTAEQARRAKLEKGAAQYAHPPSRWELVFPPLLAYKMLLKKALQNPAIQDWLAADTPPPGPRPPAPPLP